MSKGTRKMTILMADDDADDRMMAREAFEASKISNDLHFVENGEELMAYLRREGKYADPRVSPRPGIILLDLNMPKKDGREALVEIRADPDLRRIPVIILTTSNSEVDVFESYDGGANSYISKPVTFDGLVEIIKSLDQFYFEITTLPLRRDEFESNGTH